MKKYLAFFLVAVMAVSALGAAGVVTTQKADAQPIAPDVIFYKPGATYNYLPYQYNDKETWFYTWAGTPNIQHLEIAKPQYGLAYASMSTTPQQAGWGTAWVGTLWQLDLRGQDWNTIKDKPCTLTMTVAYRLHVKGDRTTVAYAAWGGNYGGMWNNVQVRGAGDEYVRTTTTWHGTVGDVFRLSGSTPLGEFIGGVGVEQNPAGAGQAYGYVHVINIVLRFN